jgi:integrase
MAKKSRTKGIYKKLGKDGAVTYAVRYYVPDESSPNGWKQQQKTFTKEAAAIEFKRDMTNKVKDGDYVAPVSFTVKEIGEKFLESKKHLKPQTHIGYQMAFTNYINPKFGSMKATSLRDYHIEAAATEWNERVAAINVNWVVNRLSNAYDFAKKLGIKVNPCNDVERRKDSRTPEETEKLALGEIADVGADQPDTPAGTLRPIRADETYSAAELKRIIDYARPGLDRTVVMTAIFTGLRHGELCGLRWSVIDLKLGVLTVNRSLTDLSKKHGGPILEPPKTLNAYRKIKLPAELVKELIAWKLQSPHNANDFVFLTERGRPLARDRNNLMLKNIVRRINKAEGATIRPMPLKALRHSYATQLLNAGVPLLKVSQLMGHSRPTTTLSIYSRWAEQEKSDAEIMLANRIFTADEEQGATKTA